MSQPIPEFRYKISLGQNFIFDEALLESLVDASGVGGGDTVLEIGAGRGDLTLALAARCRQVVALEIDPRLEAVLQARFTGLDNIRLVMGDVMEMDLAGLMAPYGAYHVVANLPYYLTTPILTRLLNLDTRPLSLGVMVQKEAAQRVLARPGTPEYGPLAVLAAYRGSPREALDVPARAFTPPPKVDSVFLTMPLHDAPPVQPQDEDTFMAVVQAAFLMRRKTLANNLVRAFSMSREQAFACLEEAGLPAQIRGERLDLAAFSRLADCVWKTSTT